MKDPAAYMTPATGTHNTGAATIRSNQATAMKANPEASQLDTTARS